MCNYLHVHCTLENHGEISEVYQMFKVNIQYVPGNGQVLLRHYYHYLIHCIIQDNEKKN